MVLSFYRRGTCVQSKARVEFEGMSSGRQLLLGFEEDQICVVREIERYGCISGARPWRAACRVWPGRGCAAGFIEGRPEDCA